jgi:hypothetical protein
MNPNPLRAIHLAVVLVVAAAILLILAIRTHDWGLGIIATYFACGGVFCTYREDWD